MNEIRQAYSDFLQQYNWDYFFTATFRKPRKDPQLACTRVWNKMTRELVIGRAFMAAEPHLTGEVHLHGLIYKPDYSRIDCTDIWRFLFNGYGRAKVESINSSRNVSDYCAKYILKEKTGGRVKDTFHYDFFGNWHY